MRTQKQFLDSYAESHQNPLNQVIHVVCVPVIFFATLGLLWAVPVGRWLGLSPELAPWINLATLGAVGGLAFYARMSALSLFAMTVWFALSVAGIVGIKAVGLPLVWTCAALWAIAWAVQFYGHEVEGAKPSFLDDMVFLLIGPLYVMDKFYRRVGI
jgi:uncharacterized membrane protein YGL010W